MENLKIIFITTVSMGFVIGILSFLFRLLLFDRFVLPWESVKRFFIWTFYPSYFDKEKSGERES